MIEQGSSQPTDGSGPPANRTSSSLHADSSACSDNDASNVCPDPGQRRFASSIQQPSCLPILVHGAARPLASSQPPPSLHIRTDFSADPADSAMAGESADSCVHHSLSTASIPRRTPSVRAGALSPASAFPSPQLAAMGDITPLPSPIVGPTLSWKLDPRESLSRSRTPSAASNLSWKASESSQPPASINRSRSKQYPGLSALEEGAPKPVRKHGLVSSSSPIQHTRNRSLSDYVPPPQGVYLLPRPVAVSGTSHAPPSTDSKSNILHRENYLAVDRGIVLPTVRPPTPPRSSGGEHTGPNDQPVLANISYEDVPHEIYFVRSIRTQQLRKYRKLRELGHGTFSQVSLAVRVETGNGDGIRRYSSLHGATSASQKLVAVKIVEYGPAGGADEDRVEVSLKREVDILKSINHPSLVQLKAFGSDEKRALLVLDYCPGGDLFDFVSSPMNSLAPKLIRRIFAELVDAVRYLHRNFIVHRDIKLENVLVNMPASTMESITDWETYDRAVVTLTDLGLSRRIPEPPESPLLHTRCGSEDYAAPEILIGQPYDGRSTDAWALGVLLYAMMEGRLPFDALPGTRGDPAKLRARTPHRIARCEWSWYRYADSDGEWDPVKGRDLEGARECVEALLKRNTRRKTLDEISTFTWIRDAINAPDGLKRGDKEVP
ncbi:hypothetical protein MPDQ_005818 [Monascus purpureus]|uniref:Protein kinase domain-containing protein n=1 Tax=Monascus purpureus TaxID=5098 RepID=A0A507QVP4_MONPU|nr:hypothetical protein MPDQ_005818 [Monascus purpureus]BDD60989.1 hypothetical protein MAP00_006073 [Monascus purpureus]